MKSLKSKLEPTTQFESRNKFYSQLIFIIILLIPTYIVSDENDLIRKLEFIKKN